MAEATETTPDTAVEEFVAYSYRTLGGVTAWTSPIIAAGLLLLSGPKFTSVSTEGSWSNYLFVAGLGLASIYHFLVFVNSKVLVNDQDIICFNFLGQSVINAKISDVSASLNPNSYGLRCYLQSADSSYRFNNLIKNYRDLVELLVEKGKPNPDAAPY